MELIEIHTNITQNIKKGGKNINVAFTEHSQLGSRHSSSNAESIIESNPPEKRTATGVSASCLISQVTAYAFHVKRILLIQKAINQITQKRNN